MFHNIGLPIFLHDQVKDIPNALLNIFGLPSIYVEDQLQYSPNRLISNIFGFNIIQLIGIFGLLFLASIVVVSVILPNLYFSLMLHTDISEKIIGSQATQQIEAAEKKYGKQTI